MSDRRAGADGPRLSPLRELVRVRFLELAREPEAVFWTFVFPILLAVGLGIAFRNKPAETVHVGVVRAPPAADLISALKARDEIDVTEVPTVDSARSVLRSGKIALILVPGDAGHVDYLYDDTRPDARTARLLADDAIQRGAGRDDPVTTEESFVREPGSRYIDFVIPGLLGMNIMGSSIWSLGFTIVDARRRKLLKRFVATPMSRTHYLLSFLISRLVLLVLEIGVVLGFAVFAFGVPVRGSVMQLIVVALVSALGFGALGLLLASRVRTIEAASGLMNVAMMPMWVLSGVFFSAENFPQVIQPLIQVLPLTATIDAFRATMLRGEGWLAIAPELAILATWAIVCGPLALKLFRWR